MRRLCQLAALPCFVLFLIAPVTAEAGEREEALWNATKEGDVAAVKKLLGEGVDVNARNRYDATALFFACDRGHTEVARVLLEHGADVNAKDNFYNATPLTWAVYNDRLPTVRLLLENGAEGLSFALNRAINGSDVKLLAVLLEAGEPTAEELKAAVERAEQKLADSDGNEAAAQVVAKLKAASPPQE